MDDEIKPLLYCRRPCNPKFQCCLWAARVGPVDKKSNPNAEEAIYRALCNIEIWGLGVYLILLGRRVCRVDSVSNSCHAPIFTALPSPGAWHLPVPPCAASPNSGRCDSLGGASPQDAEGPSGPPVLENPN